MGLSSPKRRRRGTLRIKSSNTSFTTCWFCLDKRTGKPEIHLWTMKRSKLSGHATPNSLRFSIFSSRLVPLVCFTVPSSWPTSTQMPVCAARSTRRVRKPFDGAARQMRSEEERIFKTSHKEMKNNDASTKWEDGATQRTDSQAPLDGATPHPLDGRKRRI